MTERVDTGVVVFGDDWPGLFIRGDTALAFADSLRKLLQTDGTITSVEMSIARHRTGMLLKLLEQSDIDRKNYKIDRFLKLD